MMNDKLISILLGAILILLLIFACFVAFRAFTLNESSSNGTTAIIPTSIIPTAIAPTNPSDLSSNIPTPVITPQTTQIPTSAPINTPTNIPVVENNTSPPPMKTAVTPEEVETILSSMTLDQKIGQMLMVGMPGPQLDANTQDYIQRLGIGGIIFLDQNIQSAAQLRTLTESLQTLAMNSSSTVPLFIAWNYEGGDIIRENTGMTAYPSNMAVGAVNSPEQTYKIGQAIGQEMKDLGINMNYAPVLDINTDINNPIIGLRSYGESADLVATLGGAYIQGLQDSNIIAVAKHFPGHGDVNVDSHHSLPTILASEELLHSRELMPFETAISNNIGGIMMGHLYVPELLETGASVQPSSLSRTIVTDLLRQEMGYNQVIMTDDMGMGAITDSYDPTAAAIEAIKAGNDLLLSVNYAQYPTLFHAGIKQAVLNGTIQETQIDDSVRRILRLKLENNLQSFFTTPNEYPDHRQDAYVLGKQAVEAISNQEGMEELGENNNILLVSPAKIHGGTTVGDNQSLLNELLTICGNQVTELFYDPQSPSDVQQIQAQVQQSIPSADIAIIMTWDAALKQNNLGDLSQVTLVNSVVTSNIPTIHVAGHNPHDVELFPQIPLRIMTYGNTYGQIAGIVDHLPVQCSEGNSIALPAP